MADTYSLIRKFADDVDFGFSIGTFGASGEFMRTAAEPCRILEDDNGFSIHTDKGGLEVFCHVDAEMLAYTSA